MTDSYSLKVLKVSTTGTATTASEITADSTTGGFPVSVDPSTQVETLLLAILVELRISNVLLRDGLNVNADIDAYRVDPSFTTV